MQKKASIVLLTSNEGEEAAASRASFNDAKKALAGVALIHTIFLDKNRWRFKLKECIKKFPDAIFFLVLHGGFSENGILQKYCEEKNIPISHSCSKACRVLSDKHATKLLYRSLDIPTPSWIYQSKNFGRPIKEGYVQKPIHGGSKKGIKLVSKAHRDSGYLFEEPIKGTIELSVTVIGSLNQARVLPCVIRKRSLDCIGKLSPSKLHVNDTILKKCSNGALKIHKWLGCKGVTKTDFLVDQMGKIWAIETDNLPGLSRRNAAALSAHKAGISYRKFLQLILQ